MNDIVTIVTNKINKQKVDRLKNTHVFEGEGEK